MSNHTQLALDKEELRYLIADVLEFEVEEVTDDADFIRDLDVDSLMALAIVIRLENQYGVKLQERDFKQVRSIPEVMELIMDKRAVQAAS
ncbi:acyl carrier protein [Paractinoplanes lichenicola]|uniref:Acyl carrier protein n=1 Tax=Paractinoplanes lichenicola TaxID=2802976 RepID=A0ABS1W6A5_9ACTN|nr:acyl carrier protein [Actinoplanes lichenicola]MBL7262265.1 acyl carrier protein [Actinoplanes lichenicola]